MKAFSFNKICRIWPICCICLLSEVMQVCGQEFQYSTEKKLTDVLESISQEYSINFKYDKDGFGDTKVKFADWRFRPSLEETLNNVLKPINMDWFPIDDTTYLVSKYQYHKRRYSEGRAHLEYLLTLADNAERWEERRSMLKNCIVNAMGLNLYRVRNPLNPLFSSKRVMDGYTVENVAFESVPGYFVTGCLYRPIGDGTYPAILSPHGHFYENGDRPVANTRGRFHRDVQYRCALLARMGAVVLSYDMYSWGESASQTGGLEYHNTGFSLSIQTWNSVRGLDFLCSLPDVDTSRIGITGASGGGTQTFLLAALDKRITASCPVVMVSASFFGGCPCESGLPIHACGRTNNAEIAALSAPNPQLIVSIGNDWTETVPSMEYPYLKKIYSLYGKENLVSNVHLPSEQHDYGVNKRQAMCVFFATCFDLDIEIVGDHIAERENEILIESAKVMVVFNEDFPLPATALKSHNEIVEAFNDFHRIVHN